ncbi:fibrocystin-L-like [Pollicipes pollicipes]|uniref:fibrocystin-L-like n=1 Tax=Pollicipes pollicipes TaxID=41117 RepID=UPI00188495E2|nr:fibrocystin-L-like [Pollicipes pollicipes]
MSPTRSGWCLGRWTYSCVDVVDGLGEDVSHPVRLRHLQIPFSWAEEVFFDDISFSTEEKTLISRRPAARLGADPLFVRDVQVMSSSDPLTVHMTLEVAQCASSLSLFRVAGTNGTALSDTSKLDSLEMTGADWGAASVRVARNVSASPPPSGTWDIMFDGRTIAGVPTNLTAEGMTLLLGTGLAMPGMIVARWGACHNLHWNVAFRHHGGRQPLLAVNGSGVLFDGDNLQVGVWKDTTSGEGGVTHPYLPADLTRQPLAQAALQVQVSVASVTGQCASDCQVTYDAALNSLVTAVTSEIEDDTGDVTVALTGVNLGSTAEGVSVTLTGAVATRSCTVTSATSTQVTCTANSVQAGRYNVTLTVSNQGMASGGGSVDVTPLLTSVTPGQGSPLGGTVISVRGRRLPHALAGWQFGEVTVGGATCRVINTTSTASSCEIQGTVGEAATAADVTVAFGDRSTALAAAFSPLAENAVLSAINESDP